MERKIIFKKNLNEITKAKNLDDDFIFIQDDSIFFNADVTIEYIYSGTTTMCIITLSETTPLIFNVKKRTKGFMGVAKLYAPDKYDKKVGEKEARIKAMEKFDKYINRVIEKYKYLLTKFEKTSNIKMKIAKHSLTKGK